MKNKLHDRKEHELPKAILDWGWKYHHMGDTYKGEKKRTSVIFLI